MAAVKKILNNKWVISIALNIIALFVILLFFEITPKSDDYHMVQILYGSYSDGEYSQFIMYVSSIIGLINKWLLQIFPYVAWYYVMQFILMVLCFSFILRIELDLLSTKCALIYWAFLIPICGYEFYSKISFSKTAALLIITGLLCLLYAIGNNGNNKVVFYILGFIFVVFGILYRSLLFNITLFCFLPALVLEIKHLWQSKKKLCKLVLRFFIVVIALFVFYEATGKLNNFIYANSEWSNFSQYNSLRSKISDYPMLNYEENSELYQEYGITESIYSVWQSYQDVLDMTVDDFETMNQFLASPDERNINVRTFFNTLCSQLSSNLVFYVFLIFLIFLILSKNKDKRWLLLCVCGVLITSFCVLYYRGRLQEHINSAIFMACAMQLMYYSNGMPNKKYKSFAIGGIVYLMAILFNYNNIANSSYYSASTTHGTISSFNDQMNDNYKILSLMSEDKNHYYLMSSGENNHIYQCFPALTVIPKQFYSNIGYGEFGISHVLQERSLDNYGLYIPYRDMVDNLNVFYCFTDWTEYQVDVFTDYIKDEYGIECVPVLLKQIEDVDFYRYCSHNLILEDIDYIDDTSDITYQIDIDEDGDELDIIGYAFIEGEDSFAQNIYVLLEDPETDEDYYYYTLQTENESLKHEDKYNGKYSDFSASIDLQESGLREYLIYVILEINNNYYKIAVRM